MLQRWNVRILRQKIGAMLFQRTALSKDTRDVIAAEIANLRDGQVTPETVFRDPYLLAKRRPSDASLCANDGVVAFLNVETCVQSEFLYHYLASITDSIREKVKQGSGPPNLNTDIVKDLRFGLPALPEQGQIVTRITALADEFDTLTTEAQRAIAWLDLERQVVFLRETELQNATIASYDAHRSMGTQALNSPIVMHGLLDILLNHSGLYEQRS